MKPILFLLAISFCHQILADETLTPTGAIWSGNANNTIPAWKKERNLEQYYEKLSKTVTQERPRYIITAKNFHSYQPLLSKGQIALFQNYPDTFNMPVYQTHRSAHVPEWFAEATQKNAGSNELNALGELLTPNTGIPFPIPKTAEEIIWNSYLAWRGISAQFKAAETVVNEKGNYSLIENSVLAYLPYADPDFDPSSPVWIYTYYLSKITAPPRLSGGALLIYQSGLPLTRPRQSWLYVASQRRSRRAPDVGYDTPLPTSKGIRVVDEINIFNGALDRYNWEIIGKKEMLIPYNNAVLKEYIQDSRIARLLTPLHTNPDLNRYERHRVWVIRATLKSNMRHIYAQRILYVDEDSWSIIMADMYNANHQLERFSIHYPWFSKQLPGFFFGLVSYFDIENKRYFIQAIKSNGIYFSDKAPDKNLFLPKSLKKFATTDKDAVFLQ